MNKLGLFIADTLKENHQIPAEEYKIYAYLFSYIIEDILFNFSILAIGIITKNIITTLFYLLTSLPLRYFSGGFHANTKLGCLILSYSHYILVLFLTYQTELNPIASILLYFFCWFVTLQIAPVDTPNKRLSKSQQKKLHFRCIITFFTMTFIYTILWKYDTIYTTTITICVTMNTIGLLIGLRKNRRTK